MKTIMTAKLQLPTTPDRLAALRASQLTYRNSLNVVSRYAFAHGKMSNTVKLQEGTYGLIASHIIWCPKQRKAILVGKIKARREELRRKKSEEIRSKMHIRYKHRGELGFPHVVEAMVPITGIRFWLHTRVAREQLRESLCVNNCTEAPRP